MNAVQLKEYLKTFSSSAVLKHKNEYKKAMEKMEGLGLLKHPDEPKNWDSLAALSAILKYTNEQSRVLDAGGEYYSAILPQLGAIGYQNLFCINLAFKTNMQKGVVKYEKGDITRTRFKNEYFDAITCLSVIEHGIKLEEYFGEMARILKPGGILFSSTDYWHEKVDTKEQMAFGVPIHIFNPEDINRAITLAKSFGFELVSTIDLVCDEKTIEWKPFDLKYTFIYFILRKN